jgi:hypothetical protein
MAPYQSSFKPPPRSESTSASLELGVHTNISASGKAVYKGVEMADSKQVTDRAIPRQTGLPRPSGRSTSSSHQTTVTRSNASTFGLRRPFEAAAPSQAQVIRPKTSRNVLRRKTSNIAQQVPAAEAQSRETQPIAQAPSWSPGFASQNQNILTDPDFDRAVIDDARQPTLPNVEVSGRIIPELDRYRKVGERGGAVSHAPSGIAPPKISTHDLPPPTPLGSAMSGHSRYSENSGNSAYSAYSGYSASPTTRFSESPGPGAYSRDTTPTSISSHSPGIAVTTRITPRLRQTSPTRSRPPVTRRRAGSTSNEAGPSGFNVQGLPSLRESVTSSSSNSTVKDSISPSKQKKKKRLSPTPPSPPPRKSSQKFSLAHPDEEDASHPIPSRTPVKANIKSSPSAVASSTAPSSKSAPSAVMKSPPPRPSRDGIPDLQGQFEGMKTVIQSNLAGLPFPADKRQSTGYQIKSPSSIIQSKESPQAGALVMQPRDHPLSPVRRQRRGSTTTPSGLGVIPDLRPLENPSRAQHTVPASRTPSPSVANPKHRFALFGRRYKQDADASKIPPSDSTAARKGPAAGTGHEGYGRYAYRGRSDSNPSTRHRSHSAASSSQNSFASVQTQDPFLLERMSPVIITGGGRNADTRKESSDLPRSESSQSLPEARPSTESRPSFSQPTRSKLSNEISRTTLWPSALPQFAAADSTASLVSKGIYLSESSEESPQKPSLALRRSMHRLQTTDQKPLNIPQPLKIVTGGSSPGTSSLGTSLKSDDTGLGRARGRGRESENGPRKLSKRRESPRKWNFFKRSQSASAQKAASNEVLPVVVARTSTKQVPYYAMMDSSEQEDETPLDMEDILREAQVFNLARLQSNSALAVASAASPRDTALRPYGPPDNTRPDLTVKECPATEEPSTASVGVLVSAGGDMLAAADDSTRPRTPRPSRLAQVGRIPKVVPARPQQTSPKSFSRPFARLSTMHSQPSLPVMDQDSIALGPSLRRSPSPRSRATTIEDKTEDSKHEESDHNELDLQNPFLVMPPRKNSTGTSSSSGAVSYLGTTAVIPDPEAALEEDEVWNEYDDLLGSDDKPPLSATSSHGRPFKYESFIARAQTGHARDDSSTATTIVPLILESGSSGATRRVDVDVPAFKASLGGLPSPGTPMSFTEFISGYGDRNNSLIMPSSSSRRHSSPHSQRNSRPSSGHSRSGSMGDRPRASGDSRLMTIKEQNYESPLAQVNLRVGSMTVSKWLTFGHVLFSPVRDAISQNNDPSRSISILVVDGLGNGKLPFLVQFQPFYPVTDTQ